ncbi:hypothetical protein GIB67_038398 [Kingdonia uniflora]|uniref:Pentatricopeptide repeat-containing protein n=1 Tax=Kingdonia uniflora TaxID=39325 RepID=A0A7J7NNY0_9MAGN|nr:hypothetical protein GIB67_038398 [Kingdonia uniflora]
MAIVSFNSPHNPTKSHYHQHPPPQPLSITTPNSNPTKTPSIRAHLSQLCQEGRPDIARSLFNTIPRPTTVLWNTIIIGFICNGMSHEALCFYARMINSLTPVNPDAYTYSSTLKGCANTQQLKVGKALHCRILRSHSTVSTIVGNSLLNMYSSCLNPLSRFDLVENVFDGLRKRNVVSWNTMVGWYVKRGLFVGALKQFKLMMEMGVRPTVVSFVNVFPAVVAMKDTNNCDVLYGLVVKMGSEYVENLFVVSSAIFMYAELGDIDSARVVFEVARERDIEVWNTMIGGYVQNDCYAEGLDIFLRVLELNDIVPDTVTFLAALTAVSRLQRLDFGQQVHSYLLKNSMIVPVIISNALIAMYSKCNLVDTSFKIFEKMEERDIVSWNTMVSAFVQNECDDEGLMLVYEMQNQGFRIDSVTATALLSAASNLRNYRIGKQTHGYLLRNWIQFEGIESYLIDMYAKSGLISIAKQLFEKNCVNTKDQVTWNAMIAGYAQNGETDQAFTVLRQMLEQNEKPNSVTLASILPACNLSGGVTVGKQIHGFALRHSIHGNVFVGSALIDMYSKCGAIVSGEMVFHMTPEKNSVTYTSIILGYGQHGLGGKALSLFQIMLESAVKPDAVTFVAILSACSYAGMIDQGLQIFELMESEYRIPPTPEHYCCIVDMLGRAGRVIEAYEFIKNLGNEGNVAGIWGSLLGACRIHGELELGKFVAKKLFTLNEGSGMAGYHVLLSNIYADKGMWKSVDGVRKGMRDEGLRKESGCSWIEIGGTVNRFTAKDKKHPQFDMIYAKLENLAMDMKIAGYRPIARCTADGTSELED